MDANLLIKYEWKDANKGFAMSDLGESFIGFQAVLEELFELSKIDGELDIRTIKVSEGSVDLINQLHITLSSFPFTSIYHLYDFLQVVDPVALGHAKEFFSTIENIHKGITDYFNGHTLETELISAWIIYMIGKHQGRKNKAQDDSLPRRYASKLDQMKSNNVYQKALKPLTGGGFSKIKIAQLRVSKPKEIVISEEHLEDYLSEDQYILPDFINGQIVNLTADIVGLQSTKGETIKLRVMDIDPSNNLLIAHPPIGKGAEHYKALYGETVILTAEIYRKTMLKRPELLLRSMEKRQTELEAIGNLSE